MDTAGESPRLKVALSVSRSPYTTLICSLSVPSTNRASRSVLSLGNKTSPASVLPFHCDGNH